MIDMRELLTVKWTLFPKNKAITTSLPMSVEVTEWVGRPKVYIQGMGEMSLKKTPQGMKADFYMTLPGEYKLTVSDSSNSFEQILKVDEHQYLNFSQEFGFFFILFLFVMLGVIVWCAKIMRKKTA